MTQQQPPRTGERRSLWDSLDGYRRFYAPAAVLVFCLSFAELFGERIDDNRTTQFGNLWQIAAAPNGGPAILGIMLLAALVALLARCAIRSSQSSGWPSMIAVLSGLSLIILYVRPGTGPTRPDLADGGAMLTALGWLLLIMSIVHVIHLARIRSQLASARQPRD